MDLFLVLTLLFAFCLSGVSSASPYLGQPYVEKGDPLPNWTYLGCYTDNVANRTLKYGGAIRGGPSEMTPTACQAACQSVGYSFSGVEYGSECHCDNVIQHGGALAKDGEVGCNMPCVGNNKTTCGGANRLNVYQYSGPGTLPGSSPSTSLPAAKGLAAGWSYQGCYHDNYNGTGRAMVGGQPDSSNLTAESCVNTCIGAGYSVAGLEYSTQCFCDNFLRNGVPSAPDSDCNMACSGNSSESCGGPDRLSVYSNQTVKVLPIPVPQQTGLPGSWKYAGCLSDNSTGTRTFPYQLIYKTNNSATVCLSRCSDYGFAAGGMEYGQECYCGDDTDVVASGATLKPESDCKQPCTGDGSSICGDGNRISYYKWSGAALNTWSRPQGTAAGKYEFLIGGVVIPLITTQGINGKVTFVEKSGTGPPNSTGGYELDLAQISNFTAAWRTMHFKTDVFCSASLTLPDRLGRQINVGGWSGDALFGVRLYTPDGSPGQPSVNDWQENVTAVGLQVGRWYPSALLMANGSILVVGGENGSNGPAVPSLEILPRVGPVLFMDWLNRTDPYNLYPYLAVLPSGGIFAAYYNEARILDEWSFATTSVIQNMPGAVHNPQGGRTYPLEGAMMLLPQHAPYNDPLWVLICGGSTPFEGVAIDNCISIQPEVPNANWTIERMPSKRVMACMTALPDGTYLILNGGQKGAAGFGLGKIPNLNAVLYDPSKPVNQRMSIMENTTVARMYHSESILLQDGRVLVTGSDPQDQEFPQEYRVEVFVPPYLLTDRERPTFALTVRDWSYNEEIHFTITSSHTENIKVSLLGAESSTHGNSMGQRTIFPDLHCSGSQCTVVAPPNAYVCPAGWFQMFVLQDGVPSLSQFVRIGGDPGHLGNWPSDKAFSPLPGVGELGAATLDEET